MLSRTGSSGGASSAPGDPHVVHADPTVGPSQGSFESIQGRGAPAASTLSPTSSLAQHVLIDHLGVASPLADVTTGSGAQKPTSKLQRLSDKLKLRRYDLAMQPA